MLDSCVLPVANQASKRHRVHCHRQKVGVNRSPEKGGRYQKCKAPFGPFRFWYLTPFSSPTLKPGCDKELGTFAHHRADRPHGKPGREYGQRQLKNSHRDTPSKRRTKPLNKQADPYRFRATFHFRTLPVPHTNRFPHQFSLCHPA